MKKMKKMEGAELKAENDEWVVYKITTHEASQIYGADVKEKWCITYDDYKWWNDYYIENNNDIYMFLSKNRKRDNDWYKIAYLIDINGDDSYWNANNDELSSGEIKELDLNLPEFVKDDVSYRIDLYDLTKKLEGEIERAIDNAKDDDNYAEEILKGEPSYWDYSIVTPETATLLDKAQKLLVVKDRTNEEWVDFLTDDIVDMEMFDTDEVVPPYNVIMEFHKEEETIYLDEEVLDGLRSLSDDEETKLFESIIGNRNFNRSYEMLTIPIDLTWAYVINEKALGYAVFAMEIEERIEQDTPLSLEEVIEVLEDPRASINLQITLLSHIKEEKDLAKLYIKTKDTKEAWIRNTIIYKIKNIEIIKKLWHFYIKYSIWKNTPFLNFLNRLKDEDNFLRQAFKDENVPMDIKYSMIINKFIVDQNLIVAYVRENLKTLSNYYLSDVLKRLKEPELHQDLFKEIFESKERKGIWEDVVRKITDSEWLKKKFYKAYKSGESIQYDILQWRLFNLHKNKEDDSILQEIFPMVTPAYRTAIVEVSNNREFLEKAAEQLEDGRVALRRAKKLKREGK